jgi:hypothetical protein
MKKDLNYCVSQTKLYRSIEGHSVEKLAAMRSGCSKRRTLEATGLSEDQRKLVSELIGIEAEDLFVF